MAELASSVDESFTALESELLTDAESDKASELLSAALLFENRTKAPAIKIAQITIVRQIIIKFLLSDFEFELLLELF